MQYWLRDYEDVKDCALLIGKVREVGSEFKEIGERISANVKGFVTPINFKTFSSMYRKLKTERLDISDIQVSDLVIPTYMVQRGRCTSYVC